MLIDPFRFAKKGDQLEQVFNLEPEGRLKGVIAGPSDITLHLEGSISEQKKFVLEGKIEGMICVQCQVCLENIRMPVEFEFRLYPVSTEQQAETLEKECEPVIIEENSMALRELVVTELILSMPVVTTHIDIEGKNCADNSSFSVGNLPEDCQNDKNSSPFAILNSIKQKD